MIKKRKLRREIISKTRQITFLRNSENIAEFSCEICIEQSAMLSPSFITDTFGISERSIFQLVELGQIHFIETANKKSFVCFTSLRNAFDLKEKLLPEET
jgi:hypothetical protein